jgi:tRNA threonylcarbamoyl adenosine modification protein YeaZ
MVLGIYTAAGIEVALDAGRKQVALAGAGAALESLLRLITAGLRDAGASLDDISLIGVCTGPGSFTGLRIGVAFAKSLAQARNLPIIGISSYEVASFGEKMYPLVSVARGKPGYYYAKVSRGPDTAASFVAGERETIEQAASACSPKAKIIGPDFYPKQPGASAYAVAHLAKRARESGAPAQWTNIAIDYGQRPNAVINFERRRRRPQGGRTFAGANQRRNEGPASPAFDRSHDE